MKEDIDQKYLKQANKLEAEFFNIVNEFNSEGIKIGQHRKLKDGKSIDDFNKRHVEIWRNHEQELIDKGHLEPAPEIYRYEAFVKEISHPKKGTPIYVGYEELEFNQELTTQEINDLEKELGKTVRKSPA